MSQYQRMEDYFGQNPNASIPAQGQVNNDARIQAEAAKKAAAEKAATAAASAGGKK